MDEHPIRREPGPRDWSPSTPEPMFSVSSPSREHGSAPGSGRGWRIASIVLGVSTVVLGFMLAGRMAMELPAQPHISAPTGVAPLPSAQTLSPLVNAMGAELERNYSAETGWPAAVSVDAAGTARTNDGVILGTVPAGCTLAYEILDPGGYSLTLSLPSGEGAGVGRDPLSDASSASAPPEQIAGTLAFTLKGLYSAPWPETLGVDGAGTVIGPDGSPLVVLPVGQSLSYSAAPDGSSFELTITVADGTGASYSSTTDRVALIR